MTFDDILDQAIALLQRRGRLTYRTLKRQFQLDDEALDDLKEEIIHGQRVAVDEDERVLVWIGAAGALELPTLTALQPASRPASSQTSPFQAASAETPPHHPDAERRQLTVFFCDLVDSTALASQLDPEEWREVVRAYQQACAEVIQRFEGHIAQYLGDGLLVYFGYPQAHEDDAQRAIRAGLGIIEVLGALNARLASPLGIRLAVHIGIHTGLVVVGDVGSGGRQEQLALGETPNIAARLEGLAAPDTVVISATTARLIHGYFTLDALGPQSLKGISTPMPVYRVVGASQAQSRLDVVGSHGLTPLVGRASEETLLLERWAQVQAGVGHVVLLTGEAGIGKSRVVQALKERLAGEPYMRWECRCSPYHQHSALYPIIDLFQSTLGWEPDDTPDERLQHLEHTLRQYRLPLEETVPLLATLLSPPLPAARYPPRALTAPQQKQKTLEAICAMVVERAAQSPVLFIVEDLHWVDPSTLELLGLLIDQSPTARLLLLLTCRPEFQPPWEARTHLTRMPLSRLPHPHIETMVQHVTGGKRLPPEVIQQVVSKTDGVPLFVEELTKMVLESGLLREYEDRYELTGSLPPLAIPSTLHDSLMARLDRLGIVKAVAQLGATIGRTFAYDVLRAVAPMDETTLQHGLRQLMEAELLYQQGPPPQTTYMFKHALIQEAAYHSLLRSRRQQIHQQIAQVLETRFPEMTEIHPELLAHHYTESGLPEQALPYWQRAGERAVQRSAHAEAVIHLSKALELLQTLPDTRAHTQQALTLYTALGPALIATKGYASPEVEHAYARAHELCERAEDTEQLSRILLGLFTFYLVRAKYQTAYTLAEQLRSHAQRQQNPGLLAEAHWALGNVLYWCSDFVSARAHLEQGMALYNTQPPRPPALQRGADAGVGCLSYMSRVLWILGYPSQALQSIQAALTLGQALSHPFSMAFALSNAVALHMLRGEVEATQDYAEQLTLLSREQGFTQWVATGMLRAGWALLTQGRAAEGIAQMHQGLTNWQATGAEMAQPFFLAQLAEAYGQEGQIDRGLGILAEALAIVDKTGECWCEAELYRLQGALLLTRSREHHAEAEACLQQALAVARRQHAKAWELRAAMALSRLWHQQGRSEAAVHLLAELYGWFTEGYETPDLKAAQALLNVWRSA